MHSRIGPMATKETPAQRVARQVKALLDRHEATPQEVQKRTGIAYTTVNRWLNAEARTQPYPHTLRKVAVAFGEEYEVAFPESDAEEITVGGRRLAFKVTPLDGKPLTRKELEDMLKRLTVEQAEDVHEEKKKLKKKPT
jgi:transcriptional regulator with XRE-family HTH domain